jgi:DNA-binding IscR family transcriptional regulator
MTLGNFHNRGNAMASGQAVTSDAATTILRLMAGSQIAQVIRAAAELGLADHLDDQPRDARSLAEATSTHANSLARLLRALAAIGLVQEVDGRRYKLSSPGEALRTIESIH